MATESTSDIDFWEFVSCARCHLPYASEAGKSVPFWITECGHVICNHHLKPDQSCASCGSTGILLVPLQQELDPPMSDWFKSIPSSLDMIAYAAKFQQEVMARQIRFYRSRHQQIRTVVEKLRSENTELKRTNEILSQENGHLQHQLGYPDVVSEGKDEPRASVNQNGKRPMLFTPSSQYESPPNRPRTGSSPFHTSTSARLTIPIGQHTPELGQRSHKNNQSLRIQSLAQHNDNIQTISRPMSQQIKNFAYIPPETPQTLMPSSSHTQMAPQPNQNRFRGSMTFNPHSQTTQSTAHFHIRPQDRARNMGPPPVPLQRLVSPTAPPSTARTQHTSDQRLVPAEDIRGTQPQPSTSHGPQRFFPKIGISGQHSGQSGK